MSKEALENMLETAKSLQLAGRYAEASEVFERAVHFAETAWGPDAPEMISPLVHFAMAIGDPEGDGHAHVNEVLELERRALTIVESNFGKDHPRMASIVERTAIIYWYLGRHNEARARVEKALQISLDIHGDGAHTAYLLGTLGDLLLDMEQPVDALPLWERSLCIQEMHERETNKVLHAHIGVGRCLRALGRVSEAADHFERALAVRIAMTPPEYKREDHIARELREWIAKARESP